MDLTMFKFRHRIGNCNWKQVSSLNIDEIIEDKNIYELQAVLDNLTFCDFNPSDVRNNSIESVSKLVRIMQLITEYLLHFQDHQFKAIQTVHKRNKNLKNSLRDLAQENAGLKENSKIYERQLAILRNSLTKAQDMIRDNKTFGLEKGILNIDSQTHSAMNMELIQNLLEQHRSTYMRDIEHMIGSTFSEIAKAINSNQPSKIETKPDTLDEFRRNVETMLKTTLSALESKTQTTLDIINKTSLQDKSVKDSEYEKSRISSLASLEAKEIALKQYDLSLQQRENELKRREIEFENIKNDWETAKARKDIIALANVANITTASVATEPLPRIGSDVGTITDNFDKPKVSVSTSTSVNPEDLKQLMKRYNLGFKLLGYFSWTRSRRDIEYSFRQWRLSTIEAREEKQAEEYRKQLLTADSIRLKREQELQQVKELSVAEQKKYEANIQKMKEDFRKEKEQSITTKEELRSKNIEALLALEEARKQRSNEAKKSRVDSSVMTSMDLSSFPLLTPADPLVENKSKVVGVVPYSWLFDKEHAGKSNAELLEEIDEKIKRKARESTKKVNVSLADGLNLEISNRVNDRLQKS